MKHGSARYALLIISIAAIAACSSPSGTTMPAPRTSRTLHKSWMAFGLGPQDLLYVANANGLVNIYRYWQRNLVGILTNFTQPMGECVDNARNVYITDYGAKTVVEFPHGGTTAIRTINVAPYEPYGCAVDPATGDLAVANYENTSKYSYGNNSGNVAIYKHAKGKPVYYGSDEGRFMTLAYDDSGDLLASNNNYYYYSFYSRVEFYYLPKGGSQFLKMTLPFLTTGSYWPTVSSVNYDGKLWDVTADDVIYQYEIGVKAQLVGSMDLSGASGVVGQLALYRRTRKAPATQAVAGGYDATAVEYWHYPVSGDPYASITSEIDAPYGVAVSIRTAH